MTRQPNPDNSPTPLEARAQVLQEMAPERPVPILTLDELVLWDQVVSAGRACTTSKEQWHEANAALAAMGSARVEILRAACRTWSAAAAITLAADLTQDELKQLLPELVFFACQNYETANLLTVRQLIVSLPHDWLTERIEAISEPILTRASYWEYRRLLELYDLIDPALTQRLARRATTHPDPDIQEAGEDYM